MTPQEISNFVNKPTPRWIPYKIFCEMTYWRNRHIYYYAVIVPSLLALFGAYVFLPPIVHELTPHLGIGTGSKMPAQGAIFGIIFFISYIAVAYLMHRGAMLLLPGIRRSSRLLKRGLSTIMAPEIQTSG